MSGGNRPAPTEAFMAIEVPSKDSDAARYSVGAILWPDDLHESREVIAWSDPTTAIRVPRWPILLLRVRGVPSWTLEPDMLGFANVEVVAHEAPELVFGPSGAAVTSLLERLEQLSLEQYVRLGSAVVALFQPALSAPGARQPEMSPFTNAEKLAAYLDQEARERGLQVAAGQAAYAAGVIRGLTIARRTREAGMEVTGISFGGTWPDGSMNAVDLLARNLVITTPGYNSPGDPWINPLRAEIRNVLGFDLDSTTRDRATRDRATRDRATRDGSAPGSPARAPGLPPSLSAFLFPAIRLAPSSPAPSCLEGLS